MRSILYFCICLILAGCVSVESRDATMNNAGDGAVVVRVVPTRYANGVSRTWSVMDVESEDASPGMKRTLLSISMAPGPTSGSIVFGASLPPGRYHIEALRNATWELKIKQPLGAFTVEAGRLTDLGVLIATGDDILYDRGPLIYVPVAPKDTAVVVSELLPGLKGLLAHPTLAWNDPNPGLRLNAEQIAFLRSSGMTAYQQTADDALLFGGSDGVVRRWHDGQVELFDVGQRGAIEAILVLPDNSWVVGGELGLLAMSSDLGRTWHSIRGNLPYGLTIGLFHWHDQVMVVTRRNDDLYIHTAPTGSSQWKQLAKYSLNASLFKDAFSRPSAALVGDKLAVALSNGRLAVFDLPQERGEEYSFPGNAFDFAALSDGTLRCLCAVIAVNPYISRDMGKTWSDAPGPRTIRSPAFRDGLHGIAYQNRNLTNPAFVYTSDDGNTWVVAQDAPSSIAGLFWSNDGKSAYAFSRFGDLYRSVDDGHSWSHIYQEN